MQLLWLIMAQKSNRSWCMYGIAPVSVTSGSMIFRMYFIFHLLFDIGWKVKHLQDDIWHRAPSLQDWERILQTPTGSL